LGRRTLTNTAAEFQWRGLSSGVVETIKYVENGAERSLNLQDKRLVGLLPVARWTFCWLIYNQQRRNKWYLN
jgi:hypothetical protein